MLQRIERDERSDPYFSTIAKVVAVLGLSLDELAADSGLPSVRRVRTAASADAVRLDEDLATVSRHLSSAQGLDRAREPVDRLQDAVPRDNDCCTVAIVSGLVAGRVCKCNQTA